MQALLLGLAADGRHVDEAECNGPRAAEEAARVRVEVRA